MRTAIDEFHRDTIEWFALGPECQPAAVERFRNTQLLHRSRSKVVISDCTIFGVDNPDHYPPDLETLISASI